MKFELSEDQRLLRSSTRDFLRRSSAREDRRIMEHEPRGFDAAAWRRLAEMGYLGLYASGGGGRPGPRRDRARDRARGDRAGVCCPVPSST